MLVALLQALSGPPAFRIYGKGKPESEWRLINVYTNRRRDQSSRWPILRGHCITWSPTVISIGCDFAERLFLEQAAAPASREAPVEVLGGRLRTGRVRPSQPLASEVLAHECGHTFQALRLRWRYLGVGAAFTWWREGPHWWNWFENEASALGQFGGMVMGTG
jgi:hypothetical protein